MSKRKVALITSERWNKPIRSDKQVADELAKKGVQGDILCWDAPVMWEDYDLVILRSCWDYYLFESEFTSWLLHLKKLKVKLANGIDTVLENIHKDQQLLQLEAYGIPVIPFRICSNCQELSQCFASMGQPSQLVIKPSFSAGGHHTILAKVENLKNVLQLADTIFSEGKKIIAQSYAENIDKGELSLIYFHGHFSHCVRRFPGIIADKKPPLLVGTFDARWKAIGDYVSESLGGNQKLYMRVDLVEYMGSIAVMEVEMAEPDLYLSISQENPKSYLDDFVSEILKELSL